MIFTATVQDPEQKKFIWEYKFYANSWEDAEASGAQNIEQYLGEISAELDD